MKASDFMVTRGNDGPEIVMLNNYRIEDVLNLALTEMDWIHRADFAPVNGCCPCCGERIQEESPCMDHIQTTKPD